MFYCQCENLKETFQIFLRHHLWNAACGISACWVFSCISLQSSAVLRSVWADWQTAASETGSLLTSALNKREGQLLMSHLKCQNTPRSQRGEKRPNHRDTTILIWPFNWFTAFPNIPANSVKKLKQRTSAGWCRFLQPHVFHSSPEQRWLDEKVLMKTLG